jgi:hypothetical protein
LENRTQKTGLDVGQMSNVLTQLGGEGALASIVGKLGDNPELSGIFNMLDRDGDGNPLGDIAGMAKGLFRKN